jgi:hypothetical protein
MTAAVHVASKQQTGTVPAEWVAKMNSKWAKCDSRGRTVYVHLEDDAMTLEAPAEGFQYEEGVFAADFEPMCAGLQVDCSLLPTFAVLSHVHVYASGYRKWRRLPFVFSISSVAVR